MLCSTSCDVFCAVQSIVYFYSCTQASNYFDIHSAKEHASQRVILADTAWHLVPSCAMLVDACSAGWTLLSWPYDNRTADGALAAMTCYEADELVGSSRMQAGPVHLQCCFQAWELQLLLLYYSWASWICTRLLLPGRRQVSQ